MWGQVKGPDLQLKSLKEEVTRERVCCRSVQGGRRSGYQQQPVTFDEWRSAKEEKASPITTDKP